MSDTETKPKGRLRGAWAVLRGQRLTPFQMQAQFTEMILAVDGVFDKLNTALARLAKREQRNAELLAASLGGNGNQVAAEQGPDDPKAELRRRAFELGFAGRGDAALGASAFARNLPEQEAP